MDEFAEHVRDLLSALGPVRVRRMFGGAGVYLGDVMFGLISDDTLYLKVDDRNRPRYDAAGLAPFAYEREDGPAIVFTYCQAPPEALDDAELLCEWAREALEAARRAKAARPKRKRG
jgi:DNA transformation protein and related proteins